MTKNDYYDLVMDAYRPAEKMIGMVPADKLDWAPGSTFMSTGQVLCHLSEGVGGGLEMLVSGKWPTMKEMEEGMKLERMTISFLEHFTNHKMQLFTYLKLLGLPVNTETLYGM